MAIGDKVRKYLASQEEEAASMVTNDPEPKPEREKEPSMLDVMRMMAETLKAIKDDKTGESREMAIQQAELLQSILVKQRPENIAPPLVSVYNPQGERDHPKPELKCPMFQIGYRLKPEGLTVEEVLLLNQLEPGEYRVTKGDDSVIPLVVEARRTSDLKIERINITYQVSGDHSHDHAPFVKYLREVVDQIQRKTVAA